VTRFCPVISKNMIISNFYSQCQPNSTVQNSRPWPRLIGFSSQVCFSYLYVEILDYRNLFRVVPALVLCPFGDPLMDRYLEHNWGHFLTLSNSAYFLYIIRINYSRRFRPRKCKSYESLSGYFPLQILLVATLTWDHVRQRLDRVVWLKTCWTVQGRNRNKY
jgi:hypothetical protein